jgi:Protein of unknown function (DUF4019)
MTRCLQLVSALIVFTLVAGCASDLSSQQMAAYSVATGFLTLCDDSDFDHALDHFAKPLKATVTAPTWVKNMQDNRGNYGAPVIRALITREGQDVSGVGNVPARINFVFRTSFSGTTPSEESVSVEKLDGKWQVYDYKFHPSGKPPREKVNSKTKKNWDEQTDSDTPQQY